MSAIPPWLLPIEKARPIYAAILEQIRKLEAMAKAAGINTRPKRIRADTSTAAAGGAASADRENDAHG